MAVSACGGPVLGVLERCSWLQGSQAVSGCLTLQRHSVVLLTLFSRGPGQIRVCFESLLSFSRWLGQDWEGIPVNRPEVCFCTCSELSWSLRLMFVSSRCLFVSATPRLA